jgi:hypothetical protein
MVKGDYLLSFVEWGLYQFAGAEEGFVLQRSLLTLATGVNEEGVESSLNANDSFRWNWHSTVRFLLPNRKHLGASDGIARGLKSKQQPALLNLPYAELGSPQTESKA